MLLERLSDTPLADLGTYSRENRDVGGLAVQSGLDHSAVKDQPNDILIREATAAPGVPIDLHLAPRPAHNVLAHSTPEEPKQRAFHQDLHTAAIVDLEGAVLGAEPFSTTRLRLLGEQSPTDADPTGEWYCFERGARKDSGGEGWADVWKRGCFAWEYNRDGGDGA